MDELTTEEIGKPIKIKVLEKKVVKQLSSGNTWFKTKEVAKTAGKVGLMVIAAAGLVAALGAAIAYADKHMK